MPFEPVPIQKLLLRRIPSERLNKVDLTNPQHTRLVKALREAKDQGIDVDRTLLCVDVDAGDLFTQWQVEKSPCITARRASTNGFYMSGRYNRRMKTDELGLLQGIVSGDVPWQKAGVARTTYQKMIGNANSGNILDRLLPRALRAAGLIDANNMPEDIWLTRGSDAKWIKSVFYKSPASKVSPKPGIE